MRDFRDAKSMAQTLRESLTTKAVTISHSESLELVSKMLGVSDWNTLAALLQTERREPGNPIAKRLEGAVSYPAVPIRDLVPFPTMTFPLFVGRKKTMQALDHAFARQREVVLAVQKQGTVDEPGFDDVYEVGVLARLLDLERLDGGTLKVLTQAYRRVLICRFVGETGAFQAEIADISEGPIPDAPELIRTVVGRFEAYAAAKEIRKPQIWPPLDQIRDPGRVADIIAVYLPLPVSDKQRLLAMLDPVARLESVGALLNTFGVALTAGENAPVLPPAIAEIVPGTEHSAELKATLHRAFVHANQRSHRYATLEHLLLALTDDADASAAMKVCNVDLGAAKQHLTSYLDNGLKNLVIDNGGDARPTAAFLRVMHRAELDMRGLGLAIVTGASALAAIFMETQSPAARLLGEQGMSRQDAMDFLAHGVGKKGA
jgi:ATP-dependent Lon protease